MWVDRTAQARFRISLKDQRSGKNLKVELIEVARLFPSGSFRIRVNDRLATKTPEASLTIVCDRLRRWLCQQVAGG
jgi:hypothetical protein